MNRAHCLPEDVANLSSGIVNALGFIASITMLPIMFKTWRYFSKIRSASTSTLSLPEKRHSLLLWTGIMYQLVSFLTIMSCMAGSIMYCMAALHDVSMLPWRYTQSTFIILLCTHYYLLLLILFLRLYYAFERSPCRLSSCTMRFYAALYVVQPLSFLVGGFIFALWSRETGLLILGVAGLLIAFLILSNIVLYARKLIQLYKLSDGDKDLLTLITKSTLLTTLTVVISIIAYVPFFMVDSLNGYTYWIMELFLVVDVYGNYCFILLAYPMCTKTYFKLCGKCDELFRGCCRLMLGVNEGMLANNMNMAKSTFAGVGETPITQPSEPERALEIEIR